MSDLKVRPPNAAEDARAQTARLLRLTEAKVLPGWGAAVPTPYEIASRPARWSPIGKIGAAKRARCIVPLPEAAGLRATCCATTKECGASRSKDRPLQMPR